MERTHLKETLYHIFRSKSMVHRHEDLHIVRNISRTSQDNKLSIQKKDDSTINSPSTNTSLKPPEKRRQRFSMIGRFSAHNMSQKSFSPAKRSRPAHIKTTQVLFTVSVVYILSYLTTFLMSFQLIPHDKTLYYIYFLNNAANPLIYSFMNPRFRQEVKKLFQRKKRFNS